MQNKKGIENGLYYIFQNMSLFIYTNKVYVYKKKESTKNARQTVNDESKVLVAILEDIYFLWPLKTKQNKKIGTEIKVQYTNPTQVKRFPKEYT